MKNTIAAHRVVLLAILFVGTALFPMQAQAWGERGHRYQAQLLMGILPPDIREFFAAAEDRPLRDTVMYPDSFEPFETELLGRRALVVLEQHAIAHRYALHSHPRGGRGPAVSFMLLTQAFGDDEPQRAAIWAGSLLHALGDDFAANHGPLIHYLTYGFRGQSVGIGEGVGLDFGDLDRAGRRELVATLLEGYEPSIVAEEPGVVLQKIVGMGYRNAAFMTQREQVIAATFAEGASEQTIERGKQALAELGIQAVQQVADLIVTAWHFAQQGRTPQLDDAIIEAAEQETQQFLRERPLEMDSIYTGLLDPPERSPAVGIVLEPTRNFNEGVFRGGTKYILAAIMHELQRADVAYLPVDVRHLDRQDLPAPDDVPVMIVCAGSFALGGQAREAFQTYANAGGRYLWVGGASNRYGDILGPLSRSLEVADEHLRPVIRAYGEPHLEVIESLSVRFLNRYAEALGEQDYPFLKNPNTPAGWQKPICDLHVVSDDPAIKGLAAVNDGEQTVTVAAAWMEGEGRRARHVFLPEYLLAPYLLSGEQLVRNPAEPALDRVGQAVLLASLELLHGRPAPDEQAQTERSYVKTAQGERPEPIVAIDNVCAWPNLTVLRDGTIIATIFNQPSHGLVAGDVDCWASEDGGATWTKRGTPAAGHDRYHMGVVVWDPSASLSRER